MTIEPKDNKEGDKLFVQGGKSQTCVDNTGVNTFKVSLLGKALCRWKLSWQVFDAEIITV